MSGCETQTYNQSDVSEMEQVHMQMLYEQWLLYKTTYLGTVQTLLWVSLQNPSRTPMECSPTAMFPTHISRMSHFSHSDLQLFFTSYSLLVDFHTIHRRQKGSFLKVVRVENANSTVLSNFAWS